MKKLLLILMALNLGLRAMEIKTGQHLLAIFLPKKQVVGIAEDDIVAVNVVSQDDEGNQSAQNISWNMLPEELKLYIISFIPKMDGYESIKNLMLVNHALKDLVTSSQFLRILAYEIVRHCPARALDIYAWAMEHQNSFLAGLIFEVYFIHYSEPYPVDENIPEQNKNRAVAVIETMITHNLKAARDVFCSAAAQGNKKLVELFISVTTEPQKESPLYIFCVGTGMPFWFDYGKRHYRWVYNQSLLDTYGYKSPVVAAVTCRQKKIIKLLVRARASLRTNGNFMNKFQLSRARRSFLDDSVLSVAFLTEDKEILKLLISLTLEYKYDRDDIGGSITNYLLHAISIGNQELVELFLFDLKLFHINELIFFPYIFGVKDFLLSPKYTPLMIAAAYGRDDMVLYFLNHGADVNVKGSSHNQWETITETASMVAKRNEHKELSNLLRSREE